MKKFLLLLLAAVMILSMAACANSDKPESTQPSTEETTLPTEAPEPPTEAPTEAPTEPLVFDAAQAQPVIGSWDLTITLTSADMGIPDADINLIFPMTFTFNEEGKYITSLDAEAAREAGEKFSESMTAFLVDTMYAEFEKQELDKEAANETMKAQYNQTVEEYVADLVAAIDPSSLFASLEAKSEPEPYFVKDGKIYTEAGGGEYKVITFTAEGDSLTLVDCNMPERWEVLNVTFPVTLTRAASAAE